MKAKSWIKAILSGLVWGLGQLFNKQFIKALFFFIFFVAFIGIELGTSDYFRTEEYENQIALEKIPGKPFNEVLSDFPSRYSVDIKNDPSLRDPNFEAYLTEIGVEVDPVSGVPINRTEINFTEVKAVEYFAREYRKSSPETFTNLSSKEVILAEDFNIDDHSFVLTTDSLYYNVTTNKFYRENVYVNEDDISTKEYVEQNLFTQDIIENPEILTSLDGLVKVTKTPRGAGSSNARIFYNDTTDQYYLEVIFDDINDDSAAVETKYILINENNEYILGDLADLTAFTIQGPLYVKGTEVYEHYRASLTHYGVRLQYNDIPIMASFKRFMRDRMDSPFGRMVESNDYERLMLLVSFELNPEIRADYIDQYSNFFNDRAGIFVKGAWSVITLGRASRQNYSSYMALSDSMVGPSGSRNNISDLVNLTESIPIQGHISTMLLLEGLIALLLGFFFMIFMFWSVKDAYNISEKKRLEEEVGSERAYFKSVWDNGFEYIVLSPALFVLAFISIMPILFGFVLAFTSISGSTSMVANFDYVGIKNFIQLFNFSDGLGSSFGRAFWTVLGWTFIWAILSTATVFFGGFIQALILNSEKVVFRKLWRTILILPWAMPALLSQMVFSVMFNDLGFVNQLLQNIGLYDVLQNIGILGKPFSEMTGILKHLWLGNENIQWFTNSHNVNFVKSTLIVVNIWLGFPYFMALMTGIMTAIDKTLYEAADIDGATGFQKIMKITVPMVMYSTAPILIMTFSGNFNNFGVIYFITGGGPNAGLASRGFAGSTDILISWMYSLTVDHQIYNMASVFSVLIFIVVGSLTAWNLSKTRAFQED